MTSETTSAPATTGIHHFSPTVSDVDASAQWYSRVFGLDQLGVSLPHNGDEDGGYGVLLADPKTGLLIGLHHHNANDGARFDERRTGLDHLSWGVPSRDDLDTWAKWLDELGVENSGVTDVQEPMPYSVVVFRDPDGIQLELIHFPS